MHLEKLPLTRAIVIFSLLLASPSTKSMVGADQSPPTSTKAAANFDGVETATGGSDGIINSIDSPRIQNRRRGKAKAKAKASKEGYIGDGKSSKSHKRFEKCASQFIGTRTYGGSCDKSFAATIGCENEESFNDCFYQEESFDGSVSLDVCYPFDMAEALSIDGNTCMLGFGNGGILLKESADALDPSCEPKYVLKMTTEIVKEPSDELLLLYFSNDGGESFYNEDDPRLMGKDALRALLAVMVVAEIVAVMNLLMSGLGIRCYCTVVLASPSGVHCGQENEASTFSFGGKDEGCVRNSQQWEFPAYHISGGYGGKTPIGRG
ncbi:hypothetical protein THAOC_29975, partial [Thalassiosira oceanica]